MKAKKISKNSSREIDLSYCSSRFQAFRRSSREVQIGNTAIGGKNPIRIQSMTTTPTEDICSTVKQSLALVESGCEIIRITAPNKKAAKALALISKELKKSKCDVPLVADIHFLPSAALEAVEHVDKIRINPGNYADKKKFLVKEYSEKEYALELERLYDSFSPLVLKCKKLGKAMRIGTNHGSLSDRIMNRFGDTPLGMVESALEFIKIAENHNYYDLCLSMKASNPKVMIESYRLAVNKMDKLGMHYPLHLGVTEAGDGEDARIKSAIGIGALLNDGIGDTIRVSLTEDPIYEIPVAQALAEKAMYLWNRKGIIDKRKNDSIDPFNFSRNPTKLNFLNKEKKFSVGANKAPKVIVNISLDGGNVDQIIKDVCHYQMNHNDNRIEGILIKARTPKEIKDFKIIYSALNTAVLFFILEIEENIDLADLDFKSSYSINNLSNIILTQRLNVNDGYYATQLLQYCRNHGFYFALNAESTAIEKEIGPILSKMGTENLILCEEFNQNNPNSNHHPVGRYRSLIEISKKYFPQSPIWLRNSKNNSINPKEYYSDRALESSIFSGNLLCDGIGDLISIEHEPDLTKATTLAYNILQASRSRVTKTEFVACPSCGRTLFDLQSVTTRIKSKTSHLKGVTIAIMGCIVNGPGEMADADFGYVGGAPKKINLYIGKKCVEYNVPEENALNHLIELIKKEGKWVDP